MTITLTAVAAALLLLLPPPALAEQASGVSQTIPVLTADDYSQIMALYTSYGPIFDLVNSKSAQADIESLFTPDGRHVCGTCRRVSPYIHYSGRPALTKFLLGEVGVDDQNGIVTSPPGKKQGGPNFASHMVANVFLQPVAGGVNSRAYLMYQRLKGSSGEVDLKSGGIYYDFIVKTDLGWRFKHKNILFVGFTVPDSLPTSFDLSALSATPVITLQGRRP